MWVVWSFVYLAVRNLFTLAVLLGRSDRSKDLEILVLRHELAVMRRRSGRPPLEPADRALLATLSRALPRPAWAVFSVRPETLLRWASSAGGAALDVSAQAAGAAAARTAAAGVDPSTRAREPALGYQRIAGELKSLGLAASPTTVRKVLAGAGVPPAPERARQSWRSFLRQQAASTLACDFFTVEALGLQRIYVFFFISLATRRVEFLACTPNPDGAWVAQRLAISPCSWVTRSGGFGC
ncbi:MAG: helix-turn-helix domain-containing protein [Actinomycetota bacterium]|nr:helix-turn-helix domain-containing protein [Actinomycetota bacterium]